ncbi:CPBP family intramembrane metalloprotease [Clostridioides sp. ZZV15-6383]|uniref:CPBP family intramembrane glutamic endopeptidase n=1 Tax=unclassified Clostridioides TaxID=2635829 RepID=UPI001D120C1D|nr:CPBP family intramembrane metalloprotease [Clostridioides sp. ZZV14-6345]MCC0700551.1 CPBP family intramembrane metalloprotease [Clostridioides sp. ZZV15-6383]
MFNIEVENKEYKLLCKNYSKNDGIKAIFLYLITMLKLFLQGYIYKTNLSSTILTMSQGILSILMLFVGLGFVLFSKEKLNTIGITRKNLKQSFLYGILGFIILLTFIILSNTIIEGKKVVFQLPTIITVIIFIVAAISEEVVFRGYIQTRLTGLIKNNVITSFINAFLFLSVHYPVRWIIFGFSITILPGFYVVCLILLHFACDLVYRKTNCIWGSYLLHVLYNIFTAMLVFTI